eukprot:g2956.t1
MKVKGVLKKRECKVHMTVSNKSHNRRRVMCVQTGTIYESCQAAANKLGCQASHIPRAIKMNWRCGGYHWIYFDEMD